MYVYTLGLTVSPPPPTSTLESTLLPLLGQIDTSFYYKPLFLQVYMYHNNEPTWNTWDVWRLLKKLVDHLPNYHDLQA